MLDLTPCGECENDVCAEHLRNELTRLVEFFGQPLFEARFTLAYEQDAAPFHSKEYSRREMMEQVTAGSKAGTKLRPVRKGLPRRGHPLRGSARRPDPRGHHAVEVQ